MDGSSSFYWIHLINAALGVGVILAANLVYSYFRGTSLEGPLKWIAVGIILFVAHSLLSAYEMWSGAPMEQFAMVHDAVELVFTVCFLAGVYTFKGAFEKFDWASARSR